jgi:endonuclease/exonuclease/phosphatase family metal-dependent hydrolase
VAADREAILARVGRHHNDRLQLSNPQAGVFAAQVSFPLPGGVLYTERRGWAAVDVQARGARFRFVTTHLLPEGPGNPVQELQGLEVLAGPASTALPVVYVCDCNSRADGTGTATHANVLAAGFDDAWAEDHPRRPGLTCCQAEDLRNPVSTVDQRIDFVFVRARGVHVRDVELVGASPRERTADGLWPSDHAGVVATIQFRR